MKNCWKIDYLPIIVIITGCVLRKSASGNVIDIVKTEPRLVPTQSVGINVVGSIWFR